MQSSTTSRASAWRRRALVGAVSAGLAAGALAVAAPAQAAPVAPTDFGTITANPDLTQICGNLNVVIVMDASYGVGHESDGHSYATQVRDAALSLVSGFKNTNTKVGVVKFNTTAYKSVPMVADDDNQNDPLYFDKNGNGSLAYTINQYPAQIGGNTNWQSAWDAVKAQFAATPANAAKLVVFISDGAPNWNNSSVAQTPLDPSVVTPAVLDANDFKSKGGHVLAVGIGPDFTPTAGALSTTGKDKLAALQAVSDTNTAGLVTPGVNLTDPQTSNTFDPATTDTLLQPDPNTLSTDLKKLTQQPCQGAVTVTSKTTSPTSTGAFVNAVGWRTTTTIPSSAAWLKPVAATTTVESAKSGLDGSAVYQWDQVAVAPTVTATVPKGYKLGKVVCTKNGSALAVSQRATFAITGGVGVHDKVACTVYTYYLYGSSITLTPATKTASYGHTKTTITGTLRTSAFVALPGKAVLFYGKKAGATKWALIKKVTTNKYGRFSVAVAPAQSFKYYASWAGSKKPVLAKTSSAIASINVTYRVTVSAKAASGKVTLTGGVAPAARGTRVYLQRYINHKWTNVTSVKLSTKSTYAFKVSVGTTHYYYRVVKPAKAPAYLAGISKSVKI